MPANVKIWVLVNILLAAVAHLNQALALIASSILTTCRRHRRSGIKNSRVRFGTTPLMLKLVLHMMALVYKRVYTGTMGVL